MDLDTQAVEWIEEGYRYFRRWPFNYYIHILGIDEEQQCVLTDRTDIGDKGTLSIHKLSTFYVPVTEEEYLFSLLAQ